MRKVLCFLPYLVILLFILHYIYGRKFYNIEGTDKYITVWKTLGGDGYIIMGKYYKLKRPSTGYDFIKTGNLDIVMIAYNQCKKYKIDVMGGNDMKKNELDYKIDLYPPSSWDVFDSSFFDKGINSQYLFAKKEYEVIVVNLEENTIGKHR